MKNIASLTKATLILILFLGWGLTAMAQIVPPPPPPPNGGHGQHGDQNQGGSAPIGSGIVLLFSLTAAWVGKKSYQVYKTQE